MMVVSRAFEKVENCQKMFVCSAFTASKPHTQQTHSTEKTELLDIVKNNLEKRKRMREREEERKKENPKANNQIFDASNENIVKVVSLSHSLAFILCLCHKCL